MKETEDSLNKKILDLQNALIRQCVDQVKLKNDVDDFSERSDFYENLYNSTKNELYELERNYHKLKLEIIENDNVNSQENMNDNNNNSQENRVNDSNNHSQENNVNNLGSIALIKIILNRLKNRLLGRKHEFN